MYIISKIFIFLSFVFLLSVPGAAATRDVTNQSTLLAAITASVDGDIINFKEHIVVTAQVSVTKSLTFQGNGYTITVAVPALNDGGIYNTSPSTYRVFDISASGKTIIFQNLVIKGGYVTSGGAVNIASGTTVKFDHCTVSNSRASAGGGAIYNVGTCYLNYTYVTRNVANYGGGMLNYGGTFFIEYSTIIENRTAGSNGGGGIENQQGGSLYVNNSSFSNNQCGGGAGALNNYGGKAFVANTSFTGNVAFSTLQGGAIYQDNLSNAANTLTLVNCIFAYNYYAPSGGYAASSFTLDDIRAVRGNVNLYYCIYMANSSSSGVLNYVIGNDSHPLAGDGTTNDLFTGGSLTRLFDGSGVLQGSGQVFQPFLVKIDGVIVPTLKSSSYALGRGCTAGFSNGNGTPVFGYKNMTTNTWTDLVGSSASSYPITDDVTNFTRANPPAIGGLQRTVDNHVILKVINSSNGTVSGASIYGDVYPSGTAVTMYALPKSGFAFSGWTYNLGGSGTVTSNPLTISPTASTTLTPTYTSTTNYTITYLGNGNTGGTAPAIEQYANGVNATIATNSGNLVKSGFTFDGWNTNDYGSGTSYATGSSYTGNTNLTLYAKWTSMGGPLPVNWISFTGKLINNRVQLNWSTGSEQNNAYFEVERSMNAIDFQRIGTVAASIHPNMTNVYQFLDLQPLKGNAYYRLRQVDLDGKNSYSMIIQVGGQQNINYKTYLDTDGRNLHVVIPDGIRGRNMLTVYDASSRLLISKELLPGSSIVDVSALKNGIYFVRIGEASVTVYSRTIQK